MTTSTSLLEMILNLLRNPSELAAFEADTEGYLEACGAGEFTSADVQDALLLISDDQDADFSRDHSSNAATVPAPVAPAPAAAHETEHEAAVKYLQTYITNNYVDDRDTIVDNSVNQQIDTGGGDFDQEIDIDSTVASGDGAIAANGDITDSTLVTGNDNQVGDGNVKGDGNVVGDENQAVTGHDNTTSFGNGAANSTEVEGHLSVGDGAGFATGGDADVDNSDNSLDNVDNDNSDNSLDNVGNDNSDNSLDNVDNDNSDNSDSSDNSLDNVDNDYSDNSDSSDNSIDDSFNTSGTISA